VAVTLGSIAIAVLPAAGGCVWTPPLETERTDAGVNAPPIIRSVRDPSLIAVQPPTTVTVNRLEQSTSFLVSVYDVDLLDELFLQMFVNYDATAPDPPRVTCVAPVSGRPLREGVTCPTDGLCRPENVGTALPHRLEIEVYDRAPLPNTPFRTPDRDGLFSTWTFDLVCIAEQP
jgi:hypothetical protein